MKKKLTAVLSVIVAVILSVSSFAYFMGDVDKNDKVTAIDARTVLRCAASLITLDKDQLIRADIDGNGKITATDARTILRMAAGLVEKVEVTEEPSSEEDTSEEPSSEEPATEEPATEEPSSEEPASEWTEIDPTPLPDALKYLKDGKYYIVGSMKTDDEKMSFVFGARNKDSIMVAQTNNQTMGFVTKSSDKIIQVILTANDGSVVYCDIQQSLLTSSGINISDFTGDLSIPTLEKDPDKAYKKEENGDVYYKYIMTTDDGSEVVFNLKNDTLTSIVSVDKDGNENSEIEISEYLYGSKVTAKLFDASNFSKNKVTLLQLAQLMGATSDDN